MAELPPLPIRSPPLDSPVACGRRGVHVQTSDGASAGEREFTLSGAGSSDRSFDSGSFGISADYGWHRTDNLLLGLRQSVNYASIENTFVTDDFWNGATRGYADYHFGHSAWRPFVGSSLGYTYGWVGDTAFAGLETGLKYQVRPNTFVQFRAEYQWFFDRATRANDNFDDGFWAHALGVGFNF
ncbi:MAG: hypothetical protein U5O39_10795 [Gammaproteobacteria bacterium]|nr:hypothetical protein [Gammaproteobacteria bacterium]